MMSTGAFAQQTLFYNHYYINPFLYNPSYIAPSGYTELYLNYRKQWSGISGAPTTGTLNFHVPLSYKAGVAISASQDEAGLLNTTTGLLSFSYQIYLGKKITDIHKISFGLSAGVTNSRIKADEVNEIDLDDPVIGKNTSSLDGQFGLHYQYNNFRLGVALPHIFETRVVSDDSFNEAGISQLNSIISTVSYEFKFGTRFSFEPMFTYRTFETLDPQFEGLASFKIQNVGWIGGSYRQDYGAAGFLGLNIKDKYKVAYAYEFATEQSDKIGNGTHEIQLILRLGKKQFARPQAVHKTTTPPVTHQTPPVEEKVEQKTIDPVEDTEPEEMENAPERKTEAPVSLQKTAEPVSETPRVTLPETKVAEQKQIVQQPKTQPVTSEPVKTEVAKKSEVKNLDGGNLMPGHYVVVGAFQDAQNAKKYQNTLKKSGYPAKVSFHPDKGYFIVHMGNAGTIEEARELRDKYRQMSRYSFRDTWILNIE
jgi:type IX secretion system PorP/SprF family membrane protein